jgi:hypothetical protein
MTPEKPRQICVSVLLRRTGDRLDIRLGRADKMGVAPQLEHQHTGSMANIEEEFILGVAEYFKEIFRELKQ